MLGKDWLDLSSFSTETQAAFCHGVEEPSLEQVVFSDPPFAWSKHGTGSIERDC